MTGTNRFTCTNITGTAGLLERKEAYTVILQGKGGKSLSLNLKSAVSLNNFDDIDTFSVVLLFGLMTLTINSDSLAFQSLLRCKLSK